MNEHQPSARRQRQRNPTKPSSVKTEVLPEIVHIQASEITVDQQQNPTNIASIKLEVLPEAIKLRDSPANQRCNPTKTSHIKPGVLPEAIRLRESPVNQRRNATRILPIKPEIVPKIREVRESLVSQRRNPALNVEQARLIVTNQKIKTIPKTTSRVKARVHIIGLLGLLATVGSIGSLLRFQQQQLQHLYNAEMSVRRSMLNEDGMLLNRPDMAEHKRISGIAIERRMTKASENTTLPNLSNLTELTQKG